MKTIVSEISLEDKANRAKIAVILAGCGRFDGSEIHESVLTLLSIEQNNASWQCFSLDLPQHHVSNHLTEEIVAQESRNMLIESARIARGKVKNITELNVSDFDALIIPGGNGVAYNLFTLALDGKNYIVNDLVKQACLDFTNTNKPVGFICIAPAMIPGIYGAGIELTIGTDITTSIMLTELGAKHFTCNVDEIHTDHTRKIVTTPAYMLAQNIISAYSGIKKLVDKVIAIA
jgi:enhancing lycopene biosynthesis protein 2